MLRAVVFARNGASLAACVPRGARLMSEATAKKSQRGAAMLNTYYKPSAALHKAIKVDKVTRPEAIKLLWDYIKSEKLKAEEKGAMIQLDDVLKELAQGKIENKKEIKHTEVMKLLTGELTRV